ncbi:hypothetical protein [Pontibacter indicus]|uniref:Uncharacterized protein n=1 Tax=Pontibacter indicus TaxID=1317125 RepID=A0A1R3XT67_9BACT|nr:hypothetical protein [Pontibacter indicus]SIT94663.1 hypothetical protein SAMN05444128_3701 [Pontibacter indicus]
MGLDVTVLLNVQQVAEVDTYSMHLQSFENSGTYLIHNLEYVKDRCTAFQGYCVGDEAMSFYVRSYTDYSEYRQSLAGLLSTTAEEVWDNPETYKDNEFYEQICFPDNEGTFDHIVSQRLYNAYVNNSLNALLELDKEDYILYIKFKDAFQLAAEGKGIVVYY